MTSRLVSVNGGLDLCNLLSALYKAKEPGLSYLIFHLYRDARNISHYVFRNLSQNHSDTKIIIYFNHNSLG